MSEKAPRAPLGAADCVASRRSCPRCHLQEPWASSTASPNRGEERPARPAWQSLGSDGGRSMFDAVATAGRPECAHGVVVDAWDTVPRDRMVGKYCPKGAGRHDIHVRGGTAEQFQFAALAPSCGAIGPRLRRRRPSWRPAPGSSRPGARVAHRRDEDPPTPRARRRGPLAARDGLHPGRWPRHRVLHCPWVAAAGRATRSVRRSRTGGIAASATAVCRRAGSAWAIQGEALLADASRAVQEELCGSVRRMHSSAPEIVVPVQRKDRHATE